MRFRVERDEFTEAVAWAARTLPTRPTTQMQVLNGLLLDATGPELKVAAFDYEVSAQATVGATISEPGTALVPGRLLSDITRLLPAAPADIVTDGNRMVLTCGSSQFKMQLLHVEDYPSLPPMPPVTGHIEGAAFAAAVGQVAVAAGKDDTLPVLTGVRVEIDGDTLTLAATDRYRLAVRTLKWRPVAEDASGVALVPARTLLDTAKSLSGSGVEVAIALGSGPSGEALAGFAGNDRATTTRLVDGQFPPYRKLLPDHSPLTAEIQIAPLREAVKRVALVASRAAPVQLTFTPDHLVLEAGAGGEAQAQETLSVSYDGPDLSVAFNPHYLLDALGVVESDVASLGFASADDPVLAAGKPAILTGKTAANAGEGDDGDGEDEGAGDADGGADDGGVDTPDYRYLLMPIRLSG